jgi:hypothetical protein
MTRLLVALLLLVPVALAAPPPRPRAGSELYYATEKGASWVYLLREGVRKRAGWFYHDVGHEETLEVTRVEGDSGQKVVVVSRAAEGKKVPYARWAVSRKGLSLLDWGDGDREPPRLVLRLPAKPGQRWLCRTGDDEEQATFLGREQVGVPAGSYKAVRVEVENTASRSVGTHLATTTYWLAAGVGPVRVDYRVEGWACTWLLKSFTPGKK